MLLLPLKVREEEWERDGKLERSRNPLQLIPLILLFEYHDYFFIMGFLCSQLDVMYEG